MDATIEKLRQAMKAKYKRDILLVGTEIKKVEFVPFSSPRMNWVTRGGVAMGRLAEFVGAEGSGKTTSLLDVIGNFQKIYPEKVSVYVDAENTLDIDWAAKLGVDVERLLLIKPDNEYAEIILNMAMDLIDTGTVGFMGIDSLPFLIPKAVLEGTLEDKSYAGNSGVMTEFAKRVIPKLAKQNCACVMVNQLRDKIGSPYVSYNTPGGRALKHAYSQRFFFNKGKFIDSDCKEQTNAIEQPWGNIVEVKMEKNKVSKPDRRLTSYTLSYEYGVYVLNDMIDTAIMLGMITQAGAWYYIMNKDTGEILKDADGNDLRFQGRAKLLEKLTGDSALYESLYQRVNEESVK